MTLGAVRFTATLFPTRSSKKMLLQLYTLFPATHCKSCSTSMPFSRMTTHSASSSTSAASWCEPSVWTMRIGRGAVCRKGFRLTGTGDCDWYALCCKNEYCAGCGSRLNVPVIHPVKKAWAFWLIACLSQLSVLSKKICQLSTVNCQLFFLWQRKKTRQNKFKMLCKCSICLHFHFIANLPSYMPPRVLSRRLPCEPWNKPWQGLCSDCHLCLKGLWWRLKHMT